MQRKVLEFYGSDKAWILFRYLCRKFIQMDRRINMYGAIALSSSIVTLYMKEWSYVQGL